MSDESSLPDRLTRVYPSREPTESEVTFFKANPNVAGYAAPDKRVVFNPYGVTAKDVQSRRSVHVNEATRLFLRDNPTKMDFPIDPIQVEVLGPMYKEDVEASRHSILARMLADDPSVGSPNESQKKALERLKKQMMESLP